MDCLQKVRKACFGFTLDGIKEYIEDFKADWTQLIMSLVFPFPTKFVLAEFIDRQKEPLGEFTEEVVEASHQRLDKIWMWYMVKMVFKYLKIRMSISM